MEFSIVTFTAYFSAAVVAALLCATYAYQFFNKQRGYAFALAAALHTAYLSAIALSVNGPAFPQKWLLVLECIHYNGWVLVIALTLRHHSKQHKLPGSLQLLFGLGWPLTAIAFLITLLLQDTLFTLAPWFSLALAIISLVSVEHLYRYAAANDRQIKLFCMNLGAIFIYDVYRYTHLLIFQEETYPPLWQSRAAVSIVACVFMALGGLVPLQQSSKTASFNISRPLVFYATSLIGIGLLITLLSIVGYYVQLYGGNWGAAIYSFALIAAVLLMTTVFISNSLRLQLSVFINKNLFHHKYDYRSEWLRIINYLAQPAESSEVNQRAFFAVASTTHAQGGAIWLLKQGFYEPVYQLNISNAMKLQNEPSNSPFCRELLESEWVYFPDGNNTAINHNNHLLPTWAQHFPDLWLIFPLIVGEELIGFMALTNPHDDTALNWEDLDLLKTIGRQLASYLKRYQQAEQLAESKQFDTYNKLVAFIIHDLNNLIAQQALMLKNAEKHKDNPAFVDDAFKTIINSVDRMNNLLKKLRRDESDLVKRVNINDVVEQAVAECRLNNLKIMTGIQPGIRTLNADQVRLVMTISNFIKNAQEATETGGQVHVTLACLDDWAIITISDNGAGMDWDFIQNRLFKPFETTKSGKGMGIGVYLSREYINELKGALNVISDVGKGTTITITLPLNKLD